MATITGSTSNDTLNGTTGDDTISGLAGNDLLIGNAGNDFISGGAGADRILGGDGNDTIEGGTGNDTVYAGAGNDVWLAGDSTSNSDDVYLEAGDDLAYAGWFTSGDPDILDGGDGNDTLSLQGIPGNQGATLNEDGSISTVGFTSIVRNFENLIGNAGTNALTGNSLANMLDGQAGNDTLTGNAGNDTLIGGDGNNSLDGGADADTLDGGAGNDTLIGGTGNDTLNGGAGADLLNAGSGMDYADYSGSNGGVNINLGAGTASGGDATGDTLSGVDGLYGSAFNDTLIGFNGEVTSGADAYTNVFYGNEGNDYLDGAGGGDSLYGGTGDDTVLGGAGNDFLEGGEGFDVVVGGAGSDTISLNEGQDVGEHIDGSEDIGDGDVDELIINGRAQIFYDENDSEAGTIRWANGDTTTFENIENITVIPCFTPGTIIEAAGGAIAVEELQVGDRVLTRDSGYCPLRWVGKRILDAATLEAQPALQPVVIRAGALGRGEPARDMIVSPQHRMLFVGQHAELLFGEHEVLIAALHLVGQPGIERLELDSVTYIHLLFDTHEIILGDGVWTESFQPGEMMIDAMDVAQRDEILTIFPELKRSAPWSIWSPARLSLKAHEARALLAA